MPFCSGPRTCTGHGLTSDKPPERSIAKASLPLPRATPPRLAPPPIQSRAASSGPANFPGTYDGNAHAASISQLSAQVAALQAAHEAGEIRKLARQGLLDEQAKATKAAQERRADLRGLVSLVISIVALAVAIYAASKK